MLKVNRNLIYLLVALGLGAVAAFAAVRYIQTEVAERSQENVVATKPVAVPKQDMQIGETITLDALAVREVPSDLVPADAITPDNYEGLMGRVLRAPVTEGVPMSGSVLVPAYEQFSSVIQGGSVGYTLQVDETNSISGMISPGDRVDILLAVDKDQSEGGPRVLPLLENVKVLATGTRVGEVPVTNEDGTPAAAETYSNMTLELEPKQAERLTVANKAGSLRVLLRQREDQDGFKLDGMTEKELLGRARARAGSSGGVELIIGGRG